MRSVTISLVIREPAESIAARYAELPASGWCEIGQLHADGVTGDTVRDCIPELMSLARAMAGNRNAYLICSAQHGRLYRRFGARLIRSGVCHETTDDWILVL